MYVSQVRLHGSARDIGAAITKLEMALNILAVRTGCVW